MAQLGGYLWLVHVTVDPAHRDQFIATQQINVAGSRQESGNDRFDVFESESDPNTFVFVEQWASAESLIEHREQPHFQHWAQFSAGLPEGALTIKRQGWLRVI